MKKTLVILFVLIGFNAFSQSANQILLITYNKFSKVKTFKNKVHVDFNIPSINIDTITGKSYYKAPLKFKFKFKGIAFLPKDNPFLIYNFIKDSSKYIAVLNGTEKIQKQNCKIINVIPKEDGDVMMAKFWINPDNNCPLKMQITSKSNGVILIENFYSKYANLCLPDKTIFTIDMKKFKVPKMVSADINSKSTKSKDSSAKTSGTIEFTFRNYIVNTVINDKIFTDK